MFHIYASISFHRRVCAWNRRDNDTSHRGTAAYGAAVSASHLLGNAHRDASVPARTPCEDRPLTNATWLSRDPERLRLSPKLLAEQQDRLDGYLYAPALTVSQRFFFMITTMTFNRTDQPNGEDVEIRDQRKPKNHLHKQVLSLLSRLPLAKLSGQFFRQMRNE